MKKIVWMLTGLVLLLNCSYAKTFSDVSSGHWAKNIINEWTNNGIISGYIDGSFRPNEGLTKAELVTIINKINNDEQIVYKRPSKDIKTTDWYCTDMAIALKNGLIELDDNSNLNPKDLVTREEAITMLAKLFKLKYLGNPLNVLSKFNDANNIESENLPYIAAMVKEGYVSGNNGRLNPKQNITRAELVSLLDSTVEKIHSNGKLANKDLNGNLVLNGENISVNNVEVNGYIFLLKGTKNGNVVFNNVHTTKGIVAENDNVISYNDGTKNHDNLSNIEEEPIQKVQFVKIQYSETDWTNKSVTATLKFDDSDMKIINNNGKNKYKFTQNGEFTFICLDADGNEYRYTAKVDNIAKKDLEIELDIKDNSKNAEVTVNIIKNEAPIKNMYFIEGKSTVNDTIANGEKIVDNKFTVTETATYTVAVEDEAGNTTKTEFYWKNSSKYLIKVIESVGGTISPESLEVEYRGSAKFSIVPDTENGYYLYNVLIDGAPKGVISEYTFSNVTEEHTIEAVFRLETYDVEVIQTENGVIKPDTTQIEFGGSQKFTITPNEGYEIADVIVDGVSVGAAPEYEFSNIREPHTITAIYNLREYKISLTAGMNGKIQVGDKFVENGEELVLTIEHGKEITVFVTPNIGYEIADVIVDNVSKAPTLAYTFNNITSSHTLVAIFAEIPYIGALHSAQIGPQVYATVYEDYSCVIYGLGDTYDFLITDRPLGDYTELIKNTTVKLGVTNIGDALFANWKSMQNLELPSSIESFGRLSFANCESLLEVVIPNEMEEIKEGTFMNCKSLSGIIIPDPIKVIGVDAFNGCSSIETLTLPKHLEEIRDRAFKNCKTIIDSITLPEGLKNIGEEVFLGCNLLASVTVPNTVESIGKDSFDDCGTLKTITFKNRRVIKSLGREWFPNGGEYKEAVAGNNYVITRTSFTITVGNPDNGFITPASLNVKKLQNQAFTINPNNAYEIKDVIIDGVSIGPLPAYVFVAVNSTHTIDATFKPKEYPISYDLAGGTEYTNPETYNIESKSITLTNPTREGYSFVGWIGTDVDAPSTNVIIPKGSYGPREYIATWRPVVYNIRYELNGGTTDNPSTYTIETETIILKDPIRNGYKFTGWTNDTYNFPVKGIPINIGSTGDRAYTANWELMTYNIKYNLNGGIETSNPTTYTAETADFTLKYPVKDGYIFTGWTGTGLDTVKVDVKITRGSYDHREYTATWIPE